MFKSSILVVLRGLRRDRPYALINLLGLVTGIVCFLILALYLRSELTFDQHFDNHERLYRLATDVTTNGKVDKSAMSSRFVAEYFKRDHADVIDHVRLQYLNSDPNERSLLINGDNAFYWNDIVLGEQNLFEIFTHDIIYGDPGTALIDPLSIAISETMAEQYFGDKNPIGETLQADTATYKISLVFADLPVNTHAKYDAVISFNRVFDFVPEGFDVTQTFWGLNIYTYFLMPDDYDVTEFDAISDAFYEKYLDERGDRLNSRQSFRLEPLADIHLGSNDQADRPTGNRFYVYTFGVIAVLILLVACINYMNLATARSVKRAKEIGMRKVAGATRPQLVAQFMSESIVFASVSTLIAVLIVKLILPLPALSALIGQSLSFSLIAEPWLLLSLAGFALVVGGVAGLYPALYLSFIKPIAALKGSFKAGNADLNTRQALVLIQFTISIAVIACTILMGLQMSYINNKPLGFDKFDQIVVNLKGADVIENYEFIKNDLNKYSDILGVTITGTIPGVGSYRGIFALENNEGVIETHTLDGQSVDQDFFEVMDIKLIEGRPFDFDDNRAVIVNETTARQLGWDQSLGKRFGFASNDDGEPFDRPSVIGVISDYHYTSLHNRVGALVIQLQSFNFENVPVMQRPLINMNMIIKTSGENLAQTLGYIRERWPKYDAKHPFEYRFLDDILSDQYVSEQTQMRLIAVFAAICIVISCLGLFGLTAFTTQQRTREIGVRKILGATATRIVLLLFKRTLSVIAIASVFASAASYFIVSKWLTGFEYTTGINAFVFIVAALMAVAVAFATIVVQSYKTASARPIQALRYE